VAEKLIPILGNYIILPAFRIKNIQIKLYNDRISISYTDVLLLFEMADGHVAHQKKYYWMFFAQGEPEQPRKQRYSALELKPSSG
jgi:hypothetical protein